MNGGQGPMQRPVAPNGHMNGGQVPMQRPVAPNARMNGQMG